MPQITVNEIDRSVVTRVVSDDKVKILCPIIASFGPGLDNTDDSVKTFTDVTDFNRAYGYTYAEFNPFQNDKSRMYARELIKKGAAVSVVRINNGGSKAALNIDGTADRQTTVPSLNTVCDAAMNSASFMSHVEIVGNITKSASSSASEAINLGCTNIIPGTVTVQFSYSGWEGVEPNKIDIPTQTFTVTDDKKDGHLYCYAKKIKDPEISVYTSNICADIDYVNGTITVKDPTGSSTSGHENSYTRGDTVVKSAHGIKPDSAPNYAEFTFCPQIAGIKAKYTGSFGNDIAISIAQVNTTRLAESYQYASISVYYLDREVNYEYDVASGTSKMVSQVINNVTLLENKLVSTNPDSPDYFEDVDFDFIKIIATDSARSELGIVWSNINASPSSAAQYSGFPVIPLRYTINLVQKYNTPAIMTGGTDFPYSAETLAKLQSGFKGYWNSTTYGSGNWSVDDVNKYLEEVYGEGGIIEATYEQLAGLYENYKDPYIYDFDFITASGFVYEKFDLSAVGTTKTLASSDVTVDTDAGETTFTIGKTYPNTVTITLNGEGSAKMVLTETPSTTSGTGDLKNGSTTVGSVVYSTGSVTLINTAYQSTVATITSVDVVMGNGDVPKQATPSIPLASNAKDSNGDPVYAAYYTDITPFHQSMLNLVNARQDCIALFDLPRDYDKSKVIEYSRLLNTSYGTIHHPWCWVNSPDVAGKQIIMAPSYIFLYTFLFNLINNVESQKWFPPAGVDRATAKIVKRPDYEIGSTVLDIWQNDFISRVNPIMRLKQYGYVIYGQYTTLPAIDLYTHSALESLNVRLISNVVKKKIFDTCLKLAFEPNTSALWLKFYAQLDPFLRYMKYNQGLYDYNIVMDESTVTTDDINHLRCPGKVYIAPTRTAEYFDIDFIITDAGAVFTD